MGTMSYEEFVQAGKNWDEYMGVDTTRNDNHPTFRNGLDKFIGFDVYAGSRYAVINGITDFKTVKLPDEAIRKMRMLCSPHWRTILKAYEIQQKFNGKDKVDFPTKVGLQK